MNGFRSPDSSVFKLAGRSVKGVTEGVAEVFVTDPSATTRIVKLEILHGYWAYYLDFPSTK